MVTSYVVLIRILACTNVITFTSYSICIFIYTNKENNDLIRFVLSPICKIGKQRFVRHVQGLRSIVLLREQAKVYNHLLLSKRPHLPLS
jgi:hypothetical protein